MDFKLEKNLSDISTTYSLNANGTIRVNNKGFDHLQQQWKESIGKAKQVKDAGTGGLKISFFGPFYTGYNVIAVDRDSDSNGLSDAGQGLRLRCVQTSFDEA